VAVSCKNFRHDWHNTVDIIGVIIVMQLSADNNGFCRLQPILWAGIHVKKRP